MREGGGKDGHPLDIASLRGQHVANMLLKALIFIHIDVILLSARADFSSSVKHIFPCFIRGLVFE